jgi:aminomethyltransferase
MGYVDTECAADGTELSIMVRSVPRPARVAALPFIAHRYKRSQTRVET